MSYGFAYEMGELETRTTLVPGGSSYIINKPGRPISWELAERSIQRAEYAPQVFDEDVDLTVVVSAGYPGVAGWNALDKQFIPWPGQGEGTKIARPLQQYLRHNHLYGWDEAAIAARVKVYDGSGDSFGDVIAAIEKGYIDVDRLRTDSRHGLKILAGRQALRHGAILVAAGVPPEKIRREKMTDAVNRRGGGAYPPKAENTLGAVLLERAALLATMRIVQGRKPTIEALRLAQADFAAVAAKGPRGLIELAGMRDVAKFMSLGK